MSALGRARRWVFTINNFTEDDENAVLALEQRDEVVSVIAEHEEGKEGTPHIQGYVVFDKAIYGNTVEKLLGGRAWLSVARGSTKANIEYCSKEGRIIVEKLDPMCESVLKKINFARDKDEWAKQRMEHMRTMTEEEFEEHYPSYYELHRERYRSFRMEHLIKHLETFSGSLTSKNKMNGKGFTNALPQGKESGLICFSRIPTAISPPILLNTVCRRGKN